MIRRHPAARRIATAVQPTRKRGHITYGEYLEFISKAGRRLDFRATILNDS